MTDKSDGNRMGRTDWRQEVVWVCGPRLETDTRESWLSRGARKAGVGYRQIKALFHRETVDPKYSVGNRVRSAAAEARREAIEHAKQLESLARKMHATDPDFYCEEVNQALFAAGKLRGDNRSRDNGG